MRVSGEDYAKLVWFASPAISPDGRHAALVVRRTIWEDDRRSSELDSVDLTSGAVQALYRGGGVSAAAYSPDGSKLAFIADAKDGNESYAQIFIMPAVGGDAAAVTHTKAGIESFAWRPDGHGIAYAATDPEPVLTGADRFRDSFVFTTQPIVERTPPRPVHLFTLSLDDASVTQLTSGTQSLADGEPLSWAPDGKTIAMTLSPNAIGNDQSYSRIVLVNVADKSIRPLTNHTMWKGGALFSPDGSHIAYAYSNGDPQVNLTQLYLTTPAGGDGRIISARIDRPIGDYVWSGDSQSLLATAPDRTTNALYRIALDGTFERLDVGQVVPGIPLTTTGGAESPSLENALAKDGS
ncbi:MAG TPA: hypothetical protein VEW74_00060, partial [Candidatus Nitrosotalea sp.]|nr:hypothetical protein [Candidatus Nitrosotalea sp.]